MSFFKTWLKKIVKTLGLQKYIPHFFHKMPKLQKINSAKYIFLCLNHKNKFRNKLFAKFSALKVCR